MSFSKDSTRMQFDIVGYAIAKTGAFEIEDVVKIIHKYFIWLGYDNQGTLLLFEE